MRASMENTTTQGYLQEPRHFCPSRKLAAGTPFAYQDFRLVSVQLYNLWRSSWHLTY
jgi:hypothetical protein